MFSKRDVFVAPNSYQIKAFQQLFYNDEILCLMLENLNIVLKYIFRLIFLMLSYITAGRMEKISLV